MGGKKKTMKKIIISLAMIAAVGAVVVGATTAYFSDTETSTGNTFTAGSIDLGIDNASYYNGKFSQNTSWALAYDLDGGEYLFFDFADLKPGDYGEDTISIHVNNNDSWVCSATKVTDDLDNGCTEPENDADAEAGNCDENDANGSGDLADEIQIMWWADDGDNVYESDEILLSPGITNLGQAPLGQAVTVTLADSNYSVWGTGPLPGATTKYIAKAWCFGDLEEDPIFQDDSGVLMTPAGDNDDNGISGESEDGGFTCTGAGVITNKSQSDMVKLDISFSAVQSRNNDDFTCPNVPY